jgi:hypothetical protein
LCVVLGAAAIGVGGSLAAGAISSHGAQSAANTQAAAANRAADIGLQEFNTITGQEKPFMQGGYGALKQLQGQLPTLDKPFTADMMKQYSPAYQFQLEQGRQGILNGDASGVGALSGAAQKDLMGYNQNLANTSFANAFNQYQTQNQNIYSRLFGLSQLGQSAAANTGAAGASLIGGGVMPALANVGASQAAGQVGVANAWSGALQGAAPWAMMYANNPQNQLTQEETAAAYSDRRLKEDIEQIGNLDSGLPIYRYRFKGSKTSQIGVMADEVEAIFPEAVSEDVNGFKLVNYGMLR